MSKKVQQAVAADPIAQAAETLIATAPEAPAPKAKVVALRGGPAISHVKMGGQTYRVTAAHNIAWWKLVTDLLLAGDGVTTVEAILKTGVPATMVGYLVRRNYLAAHTPE